MIYTEMPIFILYAGCSVSLAVCNEATARVEIGIVDGAANWRLHPFTDKTNIFF